MGGTEILTDIKVIYKYDCNFRTVLTELLDGVIFVCGSAIQ